MLHQLRVVSWNICGDKQARAEVAEDLVKQLAPDIIVFQEARKPNPMLSSLHKAGKNFGSYDFLFRPEQKTGGIPFGEIFILIPPARRTTFGLSLQRAALP
jgi:exonuclease III